MADGSETTPATSADFVGRPQNGGSSGSVAALLVILEQEYDFLLNRLSAHLRSPEAAADALHDAYVKLRSEPTVSEPRQPRAYLYRMAINLAANSRRRDSRTSIADKFELEALPDPLPDQKRTAVAADEMKRALQALRSLPSKRREIFLAKWRDEKSQIEIAAQFGMHKRSIQKELTRAETYLRKILRRPKPPT